MTTTQDSTPTPHPVILPGSTIGILGGGQLGRMMALAGRPLGYRFVALDPAPNSPCGQVCDEQIVAAYDDLKAARALAKTCDLITYEFENVDAEVASILETESYVPQGSALLRTSQNRLREKTSLRSLGLPVTPFAPVQNLTSLQRAAEKLGFPCVLKTTEGGYDGKGQWVMGTPAELAPTFHQASLHSPDLIAEQFIPFAKELSVIVARRPQGETRAFPVFENIHYQQMLHLTLVPARISERVRAHAEALALELAEKLGVVGLIAVEMFLTDDDRLYMNELAPRPHNSGHLTLDACVTSQFEQHLRAICNLPLGSTRLLSPAVMLNIVGEQLRQLPKLMLSLPDQLKVHLYGKKEVRLKRKMGHLTALGGSLESCLDSLRRLPFPLHLADAPQAGSAKES